MIDPLIALAFSIYENKGVYCLLLGSGVSRSSEIPTGWEITLDLVRRIAALRGLTDEPNWAAWYKTTFGSEPKYSELLANWQARPTNGVRSCTAIIHSTTWPLAARGRASISSMNGCCGRSCNTGRPPGNGSGRSTASSAHPCRSPNTCRQFR